MSSFLRSAFAGATEGAVKVFVMAVYSAWAVKIGLIDSNIHPLFAILIVTLSIYGLWIVIKRLMEHWTFMIEGKRFNYDDPVLVKSGSPAQFRPGQKASVVGITTEDRRSGAHFEQFPLGTVYLVEFDDGEALDIHEDMLELLKR